MLPEGGLARLGKLARAGWDLFRLELKVLTGNRAIALVVVQAAWLVGMGLLARFGDEDWTAATYFGATVLLPTLLPGIVLGMTAVMGDRDSRQLEVTFVAPGGRHAVWTFRLFAIAAACAASAFVMAAVVWLVLDRDLNPFVAAGHAAVPTLYAITLTACLSVLFKGASLAGLVSTVILGLEFLFLHAAGARRYDPFLNPFDPPRDLLDPGDWFRILAFNRLLWLAIAGLLFAFTLALVQRRERLL